MPYREKRASERISCHLEASIISDARIVDGFIKNLSESGVRYSTPSFLELPGGGSPDKEIRLLFSIFSDEVIGLQCSVQWRALEQPNDQIIIGMQIVDPPPRYSELIRNMHLCKYI